MQSKAVRGLGPGANLNRDIAEPSYKKAIESGMKPKAAARGTLRQLGNLFSLQRLKDTARKIGAFNQRLAKLKAPPLPPKSTLTEPISKSAIPKIFSPKTVTPEGGQPAGGKLLSGKGIAGGIVGQAGGTVAGVAGSIPSISTVKELADAFEGNLQEIKLEGLKASDFPIGTKFEHVYVGEENGRLWFAVVEVVKDSFGRKIFGVRRMFFGA